MDKQIEAKRNPYPPGPLHDAWQRGIEGQRLWSHPVVGCINAYRSARRLARAHAAAREVH